MMLTIAAWMATVAILCSYFRMQADRTKSWVFDWCNALGSIPLVGVAAVSSTWPSAAVSAAFGCIGLYGIIERWLERRRLPLLPMQGIRPDDKHGARGDQVWR